MQVSESEPGTVLPRHDSGDDYACAIAIALRQELGASHRAVKTIMRWTGASERSAKNWLSGKRGPSGEHLLLLARHSDGVLECFLHMANRPQAIAATSLVELGDLMKAILALIDSPR